MAILARRRLTSGSNSGLGVGIDTVGIVVTALARESHAVGSDIGILHNTCTVAISALQLYCNCLLACLLTVDHSQTKGVTPALRVMPAIPAVLMVT
jgi:hypothetical protein